LKNARKIMDKVRSGECIYHIIEVMACPAGCVGGAGHPYHHGNTELVDRRANALYDIDRNKICLLYTSRKKIINLNSRWLFTRTTACRIFAFRVTVCSTPMQATRQRRPI
ncbi:[Fe-Fe] hydrogenase large subunit C-terminal domain-containing protein, partial [Clostridioides difficile]|uniref:[Fe-Fe] hydrogenase large subunit C-terminal domain-containing protein n=1 Tax=Clostridioides difficile TaxID=1496 RepID=UPI00235103F5